MPLILRLPSTLRGFSLYVLWTWGPAVIILLTSHWLMGIQHDSAFVELPFLVLAAGTFAAGAAGCLGVRVGLSDDAARRRLRAGILVVLRVLAAEAASGLLFCIGMAVCSNQAGSFGPGGGGLAPPVAMFCMTLVLLFLSLLSGWFPCAVGASVGIWVGVALRRDPACRREERPARLNGRNLMLVLSVAGFGAMNVSGLLWANSDGRLILHELVSGTAHRQVSIRLLLELVANMLSSLALLGGLWACLAGLWFMWLGMRGGSAGWRIWLSLAPLIGLAAFGVWCVGRFLNA